MLKSIIYLLIFLSVSTSVLSNWRKNNNMPREYQNVVYLDVYFLPTNPQYGWICGYEGKTLRTTDGGKSWLGSRIYTQGGMPMEVQLESIHFLTEQIGYTSGPNLTSGFGVIYKTTNGGATWFSVTPPNASDLWGTYFFDENVGLVIGGGCGSVQTYWRTENGGQSWTLTSYNQPGSKMADAILYDSAGLGYAVGSGTLWQTIDGGRKWDVISITGGIDWHEEVTRVDNTFLLPYSEGCFGNTQTTAGGVRITHDEGASWKQYATGAPMFGSFLHDRDRGWGVGFNRTVIYTGDGGRTWTNRNCGILPDASLDDIWFINDTTGWVVGNGVYEYFIPYADPPKITSDGSFSLCEGDTLTLTASAGYDAYIWSNGQQTRTIKVTASGRYFVRGIIDSICYDGMSEYVDVVYHEKAIPEFLLSSGGQPCEGDTVTLSIKGTYQLFEWFDGSTEPNISIDKSGTYSVRLIDSNGCEVFDSFTVNFNPNPTPVILSNRRTNFCVGDSVLLSTSQAYSKYEWYKSGSSDIIFDGRAFWVSESGEYTVYVENEFGCSSISDMITVTVRNETDILEFSISQDNTFELDSAYYSQLNCRMLNIHNTGIRDFILNDVYIFRNISFSTPQSQFPIIIPPGESALLKICFTPGVLGSNLDSLLLEDVCTDRLIKLLGFGINEGFEDVTKCDVPVVFELTNLNGKSFSFGLGNAVPNPANEMTNLKFSAMNDKNVANEMRIKVFNSLGQNVNSGYKVLSSLSGDNIINGEIILNTSGLTSGIYIVIVEIYGEVITETFTVFK